MSKDEKKVSLADKIKKNSKIKGTALLSETDIYNKAPPIRTRIPMLDVAISGSLDGGLQSGLTVIAGPSKHFKTLFALLFGAAFLRDNPDGIILFYMNEFGSPKDYYKSAGIPEERVILQPFTDIEELKGDLTVQLTEFTKKDKVMIIIDSIGNAASKKEVDDAISGNSAADMTRAKQLKSVFRIATPHLSLKDIPMIAINHVYQTQEMFSKTVVSGGTGIYYSADTIWVVGRQQEKLGKEITGYHFIINIEKGRSVKEKSKIPITVTWDSGIARWSGLFDVAEAAGFIVAPKQGWYVCVDMDTGEVPEISSRRKSDIESDNAYWEMMIKHPKFKEYITQEYGVTQKSLNNEQEYEFIAEDMATLKEIDLSVDDDTEE